MGAPLYVEATIDTSPDQLWLFTQDPARHQRWDLRFTQIAPYPQEDDGPARFRYATRVLPFLTVAGEGVHAGERPRPGGGGTSALRFRSDHPLSLIEAGSGYWRYAPGASGIGFATGYDYRPRWGRTGRIVDTALFRPLMGWATAWSFDRLRIWLERGTPPEAARNRALLAAGSRALAIGIGAAVHPLLGALIAVPAVLAPPSAGTPAARRCRRVPARHERAPRTATALDGGEVR